MNTQLKKQLAQVEYQTKVAHRYAAIALSVLLAFQLGSYAGLAASADQVSVPAKLAPGANESLSSVVPAKGVQIYECRAKQDQPGTYGWVFVAPEADLFDTRGNRIGTHYGGPHWEANDGSKIAGALRERSDAPAPNAIPWLLLGARSVGPRGTFSNVTSIQRVNTVGGVAPQSGCSQAATGAKVRIDYTADYYFFSANNQSAHAPY